MNGTRQLLIYCDNNLLSEDINSTKKNTETLLDAAKVVVLEENYVHLC
jgi:hypothetical protein